MVHRGLAADDVSFGYERGQLVLHHITAAVPRASVVGILGPNGSGKTTLLRLLAGLLAPSGGRVFLDGDDIATLGRGVVARKMAVVPQETQLAFEYSVIEVALMGRYPHLGRFQIEGPEDLEIARRALAATGTAHLHGRPFSTLSGGEKQRVVIAGALAQLSRGAADRGDATETLLLDEPTASLDLAYQLEVRTILQNLNRTSGLTVVVSTHDLNFAAACCSDLVLLDRGRILASGPVDTMMTPTLVRKLYGVDVDIHIHPQTGRLTVVPLAPVHDESRALQ
jgi:cobalamin transport system ATP-binding protein